MEDFVISYEEYMRRTRSINVVFEKDSKDTQEEQEKAIKDNCEM